MPKASAAERRPGATTVLVVEDDGDIRDELRLLLVELGHDVLLAKDGAQALRLLREGAAIDLILLDLLMPVMDGWSFRKEQLADPALAEIPVAILSGVAGAGPGSLGLTEADFLGKPFDLERLLALVAMAGRRAIERPAKV